jgi:hypothetical protein
MLTQEQILKVADHLALHLPVRIELRTSPLPREWIEFNLGQQEGDLFGFSSGRVSEMSPNRPRSLL